MTMFQQTQLGSICANLRLPEAKYAFPEDTIQSDRKGSGRILPSSLRVRRRVTTIMGRNGLYIDTRPRGMAVLTHDQSK
jgi:hypothetical protein